MIPRPSRLARRSLVALALAAGCGPIVKSSSEQVAERAAVDWRVTVAQVDVELAAGRYPTADRLLLDFQRNHPGTPELTEASLRRALFMLDPANPAAAPADARALLDTLLGGGVAGPPRTDALALRRLAVALETRPVVVKTVTAPGGGGTSSPGTGAKPDEGKAKDDEIARLRDDLARTQAELDRIRRRVATPKP